jgi:putrescine transport system substrate-binding protein
MLLNESVFKALLIGLLAVLLTACDMPGVGWIGGPKRKPEPPVLNIYNRPDYLPEGMLAEFEKETGIRVTYDTFDSNEALEAKLLAGQTGYDIVVPSSSFARQQIKQGLFQPLNRSLLPNWQHLDPDILSAIAQADPDNQHLVPWGWSFSTVGINRTKVQQVLGKLDLVDGEWGNGWELVFNPAYTRRLKSCGIAFLDAPTEVMPAALLYLGREPYSEKPADHLAASAMLAQVRPDITRFSASIIDDLASGRVCVVIGWAGDIAIAASRARERGLRDQIDVLLPSFGVLTFFDTMAIPVDAPHPGNAHKFIDFFLRPENAARMANELSYNTGNRAARRLVNPTVAKDPAIFVPQYYLDRLIPTRRISNEESDKLEKVYESFRGKPKISNPSTF